MNNSPLSTSYLNSYSLVDMDLGMVEHQKHSALLRGKVICGSPLPPHPEEQKIRTLNSAWAQKLDLFPASVIEKLALWKLWTNCARELSPKVASIISDYCLFYTVLDDSAESFFGDSEQAEIHAEKGLQAILQTLATGKIPSLVDIRYNKIENLCAAILNLRKRILAATDNADLTLLMKGFDGYRRGVLQQIHLSRSRYPISRETQIYNRQLNVAIDPTVVLLCMLNGVNLGQNLELHPLLERAHIAISRLGGVINDIISFPKEARASDDDCRFQNIVAADYGELVEDSFRGENPLELAIARSFAFHNLEMREFFRLSQLIGENTPLLSAYFPLCLAMHRSWMSWCLASPRYRFAMQEDRPVIKEIVQPMNYAQLVDARQWAAETSLAA